MLATLSNKIQFVNIIALGVSHELTMNNSVLSKAYIKMIIGWLYII